MLLFVSTCRGKSFFIGRFDRAGSNVAAALLGGGIVEPAGVFDEMLDGIVNELSRFLRRWLHSLETCDEPGFAH